MATLTDMIAHRLAASSAPTIRARAHGPRPPPPSVSARVRGMNIGSAAELRSHHVGHDLAVGATLDLRREPCPSPCPRSAGVDAPVSAMAARTSSRSSSSESGCGQELGDDGRLLLLDLDHRVTAAGLEVLDRLAALLHLLRQDVDVTSSSVRSRPSSMRRFWKAAMAMRSVPVRRTSRAQHGLAHGGLDPLLEGHRLGIGG